MNVLNATELYTFQNKAQEYLCQWKKYIAPNKVKFTKSGIQSKITWHTNKEGNITHMIIKKTINWKLPRTDIEVGINGQRHKIVITTLSYVQNLRRGIGDL